MIDFLDLFIYSDHPIALILESCNAFYFGKVLLISLPTINAIDKLFSMSLSFVRKPKR